MAQVLVGLRKQLLSILIFPLGPVLLVLIIIIIIIIIDYVSDVSICVCHAPANVCTN